MRRQLFLTAALLVALVSTRTFAAELRKLNVLFIAVDDLRPELGCYGASHIQSPHIDALAGRGLRFERAYCQLALCNPSRASLLAGRRPETLGIYDLKTFVRDGNPDVITLPQLFKQHGYRSLSFGKIFHTTNGNHDDPESWSERPWKAGRRTDATKRPPTRAGTDDPHADELPAEAPAVEDDALPDGKVAEAAIKAMRENGDTPFFLAVGFHKPHLPFVAPKRYWDLYQRSDISLASNPWLPKGAPAFASNDASELRRYKTVPKSGPISDDMARELIHGYYACVSYVDAQVGLVMAELDRLGLRERTVVILWGDHGYQLGEHGTWNKRTNWEIATRVPMILSVPEQPAASVGKHTKALVEFIDVYPTLAELCGLPLPPKLEGRSFIPLLVNPETAWKTAAFSVYEKDVPELGGRVLGRAMRTERYRFIEWSGKRGDRRVYELYDHQTDPQENINIATLPENRKLVESLKAELHRGSKSESR